jgi:hypothetical protein
MIAVHLRDSARRQLTIVMKTTADTRLRARGQAILMAHRGRRHAQSAEDLGVRVRTLQRWLNAFHGGGLDGLKIRWLRVVRPASQRA